jgi:hypothetical protein
MAGLWQDPRGTFGGAVSGVVHREDAKDRRDETSRSSDHGQRGKGRWPRWAVPVGAAVSVLLVVGGVVAVTRDGSDGRSSDPGSPEGSARGETGAPDAAVSDAAGGSGTLTGTVTGGATLSVASGEETVAGDVTFQLDCSATVCTVKDWKVTGALGDVNPKFFRIDDYLDLEWQGKGGTWTKPGRDPVTCDEVSAEDQSPLVTSTLTVNGQDVGLRSTSTAYDMTTNGVTCIGAEMAFVFTGVLS